MPSVAKDLHFQECENFKTILAFTGGVSQNSAQWGNFRLFFSIWGNFPLPRPLVGLNVWFPLFYFSSIYCAVFHNYSTVRPKIIILSPDCRRKKNRVHHGCKKEYSDDGPSGYTVSSLRAVHPGLVCLGPYSVTPLIVFTCKINILDIFLSAL